MGDAFISSYAVTLYETFDTVYESFDTVYQTFDTVYEVLDTAYLLFFDGVSTEV